MNRPRVLIVEDRPSVLKLLTTVLEGAYDVTAASSGPTAISLVGSVAFDVVLTDVRMPGATGFDVLRAVQRPLAADRGRDDHRLRERGGRGRRDPARRVRLRREAARRERDLARGRARGRARARRTSRVRRSAGALRGEGGGDFGVGFHRAVDEARRRASHDYLVRLMRLFRGNVTRAAVRAGMTRESLHRVLRQYEVRSEQFKPPGSRPAHSGDGPAPLTGREVHDGDGVVVTLRDHGG